MTPVYVDLSTKTLYIEWLTETDGDPDDQSIDTSTLLIFTDAFIAHSVKWGRYDNNNIIMRSL